MITQKKVVVAMSGGIDSTLVVRLLQEAGYEVCGATMHHFNEQDFSDAIKMADFLKIPHRIIDVRDNFKKIVLTYFTESYTKGLTPNPCMICDFKIKFGLFYDKARELLNCPYFATGHYCRITYNSDRKKFQVDKALDLAKDQSYMMYHLTQEQLAHILFPLGRIHKENTRLLAKEKGIPIYNKSESQDICFLSENETYIDYLKQYAPDAFKPGYIINRKGEVLGKHRGLPYYTIGQRRGLGIAAKTPLYVIALDGKKNRVIVGANEDLFRTRLLACDLDFTDGNAPQSPFTCEAKIRYGIKTHTCRVTLKQNGNAIVSFNEPQRAVTPGQSVVFYDNERLIGGGTIVKPL